MHVYTLGRPDRYKGKTRPKQLANREKGRLRVHDVSYSFPQACESALQYASVHSCIHCKGVQLQMLLHNMDAFIRLT